MSISDSIALNNIKEIGPSTEFLMNILETDSEDDIAFKKLKKELIADMKKDKLQNQPNTPSLTKKETEHLLAALNKAESPTKRNPSHEQIEGNSIKTQSIHNKL
jgi:hypothetical protein